MLLISGTPDAVTTSIGQSKITPLDSAMADEG